MTNTEIRNNEIAASLHLFCEPCMCGSAAIAEQMTIDETIYWKIVCSRCDRSTIPFVSLGTAVMAWNAMILVSRSEARQHG